MKFLAFFPAPAKRFNTYQITVSTTSRNNEHSKQDKFNQ